MQHDGISGRAVSDFTHVVVVSRRVIDIAPKAQVGQIARLALGGELYAGWPEDSADLLGAGALLTEAGAPLVPIQQIGDIRLILGWGRPDQVASIDSQRHL